MNKSSTRASNIELLRIVAMAFIVIGHIILHVTNNKMPGSSAIYSVCVIGVNLFVLISGFFKIKFRFRSFLNLIAISLFYSLLSLFLDCLIFKHPINGSDVASTIFQISNNKMYWFVGCYLQLMLLSPFINLLLEKANCIRYCGLLGVLLYLSCVSGWLFNDSINMHGYTTFHMIMIYVIGAGIAKYDICKMLSSRLWVVLFVAATLVIYFMQEYMPGRATRYNNPIIIASAIAFFSIFVKMKFSSQIVNRIASCVLPVYLLQEGFLGVSVYKVLQIMEIGIFGVGGDKSICISIVYIICLFLFPMLLEPVRQFLMKRPIDYLAQKAESIAFYFKERIKHLEK